MQAKVLDSSGEAWVSAFNEQAESLLGVSADNLSDMRNQVRGISVLYTCFTYYKLVVLQA